MCKSYNTFGLFNMYCSSFFFFFLWPTTNKNKYFVKMLWHLLGECVKATVLLVCSIYIVHCFFFFFLVIDLCSFSTILLHCLYIVFHCSSTIPFWLATLTFFFFFLVLKNSYSTKRHYSYSSYILFIYFFSVFRLYFFFLLYILLYWYNKFHNIFTIIKVLISYTSK